MTRVLFDIEPIVPLIDAGKLILTPNNRLRNHIRMAYSVYHATGNNGTRNTNNRILPSPRVFSYREWQTTRWLRLQDSAYPPSLRGIATNSVCELLWQQVIEQAGMQRTGVRSRLELRALATQARQAHDTLCAWRCPSQSPDYDREISTWSQAFEQKLEQRQLISETMAQAVLAQGYIEGRLPKEAELYLHSFIEITPLGQYLLDQATSHQHRLGDPGPTQARPATTHAIKIHASKTQASETNYCRTAADNQDQEIVSAAIWAWQILQQQPGASIAIVAPRLAQDRDRIERHFTGVFEAHGFDPRSPRTALPFNISVGQILGHTPLIASTLQLLSLNRRQTSRDQAFAILNSPFYGDRDRELALRADLVRQIKERGSFTCSPSDIAQYANKFCQRNSAALNDLVNGDDELRLDLERLAAAQQWTKNLYQLIELRRRQKKSSLPSQWMAFFLQQLQHLGWPGQRRIDSIEYQQISHWYQLLEQFAALDCLDQSLDFDQAIAVLTDMAMAAPFQAETRDTPIHILGAFEVVGLQFSHCWVLGLNDKEWPTPLRPNPLLPKRLQMQQQMPRASLQREIELAQTLTGYFLHAAPQVVVSYSRQHGNAVVNESPLIRHLNFCPLETIVEQHSPGLESVKNIIKSTQHFEWVDCACGPLLESSAEKPARGGQNIFKQQALCPFNAFAQLRLHATEPDPPRLGLSAAEKGNIVHAVLATLWQQLQNQAQLLALGEQQLSQKIHDTVASCFRELAKKDSALLGEYYYQLEQQRIIDLVAAWLALEQQRPPFRVIGTEQSLTTEFAGIHLHLRIDRIDQLESGEILLFDYKTSTETVAAWLQERPAEPQLPLYSLCYPDPVTGIGFAILNADAFGFRGIADHADQLHIEGIKTTGASAKTESWSELIQLFQTRLQQLAAEIVVGDCRVMFQAGHYQLSRDPLAALNRFAEADFIDYRLHLDQGRQLP